MRHLLLVLLVLGCRSQRALVTPGPEAGAAAGEGGTTLFDARPDAPSLIADATPDARTLPAIPDAPPADLAADRPPVVDLGPAAKCELQGSWTACLDRADGKSYARRRDGLQCGLCKMGRDAAAGSIAHCLMGDPNPDDPTVVYCARSCFDCCHVLRGAPCETASDCCLPQVCISSGALRFCDLPPP